MVVASAPAVAATDPGRGEVRIVSRPQDTGDVLLVERIRDEARTPRGRAALRDLVGIVRGLLVDLDVDDDPIAIDVAQWRAAGARRRRRRP